MADEGSTRNITHAIGDRRTSPNSFSQATRMYIWVWRSVLRRLPALSSGPGGSCSSGIGRCGRSELPPSAPAGKPQKNVDEESTFLFQISCKQLSFG